MLCAAFSFAYDFSHAEISETTALLVMSMLSSTTITIAMDNFGSVISALHCVCARISIAEANGALRKLTKSRLILNGHDLDLEDANFDDQTLVTKATMMES
jgi:hypothetical protein